MKTRPRLTWKTAACVAVILVALFNRLAIVGYALPYIENPDEVNMYLVSSSWRGRLDAGWRGNWLKGYPPGYLWLGAQLMNAADTVMYPHVFNIHTDTGQYVRLLRLASLLADMVTLVALMLAARILAGDAAALLAGAVWAVSAESAFNAISALPDSVTLMFCALCILFGLLAVRHQSGKLAFVSTLLGLIAVVFKYSAFPALIMPAFAFAWLILKQRQRVLGAAIASLMAVSATAYWLLVVYGAAGLSNQEANEVRSGLLSNLLQPARWEVVYKGFTSTLGWGVIVLAALAAVLLYRRRARLSAGFYGLLLTALGLFMLVPLYVSTVADYPSRYTWFPAFAGVLVAVTVIDCAFQSSRWRRLALLLPVLALLPGAYLQLADKTRPDTHVLAQTWIESNLPAGARIWLPDYDSRRTLSRYEGGYPGFKQFNAVYGKDDAQGRPEQFDFVYLTSIDAPSWKLYPNWPPLDQLTLLKHIGGAGLRGPEQSVYWTHPAPHPDEAIVFSSGSTRLVLRWKQVRLQPESLDFKSLWQADQTVPPVDYSYFLHVVQADNPANLVAQQDGPLGSRPTSTWTDRAESLLFDTPPLQLPALPAGHYQVMFGVYDWRTGERLHLNDGATELNILQFDRK